MPLPRQALRSIARPQTAASKTVTDVGPGYVPGRYYLVSAPRYATSENQPQNLPYCTAIFVPYAVNNAEIHCRPDSSSAYVKTGLYSSVNGRPGVRLYDFGAKVLGTSNTVLGAGVTLEPGWYWTAIILQAAYYFYRIIPDSAAGGRVMGGVSVDDGFSAQSMGVYTTGYTYAGGLPAEFPIATGWQNYNSPAILMRQP